MRPKGTHGHIKTRELHLLALSLMHTGAVNEDCECRIDRGMLGLFAVRVCPCLHAWLYSRSRLAHTHKWHPPLPLDSRIVSCRVDVLLPLLLLQLRHVMHRVVEVAGLRASLVRSRIIRAPCASMLCEQTGGLGLGFRVQVFGFRV